MRTIIKALLSVFFFIAFAVHIHELYVETEKQVLWHTLYFITYGVCWWMVSSANRRRLLIYILMALFPFITHLYYGYRHIAALDIPFWVCVAVCVLLPAGGVWIWKEEENNKSNPSAPF
ncbi:MAG: hypothetical protein U0T77_08315 [Chitinophagales bacterium]